MTIANGQVISASDFRGGSATFPAIGTTTGTTHSLTTDGTDRVIVWAKGNMNGAGAGFNQTISLLYDGVTKDVCSIRDDRKIGFALMYTETPSAGTRDITVTTSGSGIENVKIIVMKF
jgi:hypothetical protein